MRVFLRRIALFSAATLLLAGVNTPAQATGKVKCSDAVDVAAVNPIEHHNQPNGEDALYSFFGNENAANASVNYDDLAGRATSCNLEGDSAVYLVSTVLTKRGGVVTSHQSIFYYRPASGVGGPAFDDVTPFPPDTRLAATGHNWTCGQKSGDLSEPSQDIPDCSGLPMKPGLTLTLHMDFPSCYDGTPIRHKDSEVGDTTDNEHFTDPVRHDCPSDFPIEVPALRMAIQYDWVDDPRGLATDGTDIEGFFWNTWVQPDLGAFVQDCIDPDGDFSNAECNP